MVTFFTSGTTLSLPKPRKLAVRQFAETKQAVWRLRGFLDGQWRMLDHLQESQRRSGPMSAVSDSCLRQLGILGV